VFHGLPSSIVVIDRLHRVGLEDWIAKTKGGDYRCPVVSVCARISLCVCVCVCAVGFGFRLVVRPWDSNRTVTLNGLTP
jgi:hypothetical protein